MLAMCRENMASAASVYSMGVHFSVRNVPPSRGSRLTSVSSVRGQSSKNGGAHLTPSRVQKLCSHTTRPGCVRSRHRHRLYISGPPGDAVRVMVAWPPACEPLTISTEEPFGPDHCAIFVGSAQASWTRSGEAAN
jgi:hypothetical protein